MCTWCWWSFDSIFNLIFPIFRAANLYFLLQWGLAIGQYRVYLPFSRFLIFWNFSLMVWPDTSSEQPYRPLLSHLPCTPERNCKYQLIYFCPDTYLKVWAIWGESGNLSVSCLVHLRAPSTSSFEYSFRKQGKCPFKLFDISSWYLAVLTWGTWRGLQSPCIPKTRLRIFGTPNIGIISIYIFFYIEPIMSLTCYGVMTTTKALGHAFFSQQTHPFFFYHLSRVVHEALGQPPEDVLHLSGNCLWDKN